MTVNLNLYLLILAFGLLSCNEKKEQTIKNTPVSNEEESIKFHDLRKLFVVGHFDNDDESDTVYQHNFSRLTRTEISKSADPFQNEWETVVKWFYNQDADLYLAMNNQDTLHLGTAQGLYCLINVGDNNSDGKDEIAFVIDYCDFSSLNSCKIYSLCKDKWTLLNQFTIHEGSFDWTKNELPIFDNVKNYLEKLNDKWFYLDYSEYEIHRSDSIEEMKILKIRRCENDRSV